MKKIKKIFTFYLCLISSSLLITSISCSIPEPPKYGTYWNKEKTVFTISQGNISKGGKYNKEQNLFINMNYFLVSNIDELRAKDKHKDNEFKELKLIDFNKYNVLIIDGLIYDYSEHNYIYSETGWNVSSISFDNDSLIVKLSFKPIEKFSYAKTQTQEIWTQSKKFYILLNKSINDISNIKFIKV
ncbi:hypothetical protein RRG49_03355 [Mycoplasmopsis felis]|uniref:hypothetical protein n=1 Tax=Mycoplasmopsis felis TaxID=33923 RepID=UPI002AFF5108|nr:hypothetical protein [Mycoplasmopsis felis]WQQ03883.1 hypothetical protein RRG47_03595 [Mycoplasmopsis felis]WQQ09221.1 hypothetical protein RRG41_03760 [Mycoplasmopsis felis]WQQ11817.1 hypothetical protein RRG50_00985 [Mycoplasmopsis felis]